MENKKNQELYLKEIGCELGLFELEAVFMILNAGEKYIRRNLFLIMLKDFSGISLDESKEADIKKIEVLLSGLCRKGFIEKENLPGKVVLTEKAMKAIDKLTRNPKFWKSFSTKRWRQVIFKKSRYEGISLCEIKIIKELMKKEEVPIRFALDSCFIGLKVLRLLAEQKRISVDQEMYVIRRGSRFIEGVAESVHSVETKKIGEIPEEWQADLKAMLKAQKPNVARSWKRKYAAAYEKAREFDTCPVGLPADCKYVFKEDMDSIIPLRQLSVREMDLRINIKKGFGYHTRRATRSYKGLVIEFIQSKHTGSSDCIAISGTKREMLEFFENIRNETEKMSKETGLELEERRIGEAEIAWHAREAAISILALADTHREKIAAVSFNELCEIIETLGQYPD